MIVTLMIVAVLTLCALVYVAMIGPFPPQRGEPPSEAPRISEMRVREIAREDAEKAYRDLSAYEVKTVLEKDGWHVDYELKEKSSQGGGPHYLIDAQNGQIVKKEYDQ